MSIPKSTAVSCPNCKKQFEAIMFESLNTDYDSTVIESVIRGDRFSAKCPHCGFVTHLEYDLLYHDMKHQAMIWVIHKEYPEHAKKVDEVKSTRLLPYNMIRIVPDINALREKAACLASGKDDRVIELCKVYLVTNLKQQRSNFDIKNVFYTYQGGKNTVLVYGFNGEVASCELDDNIYNMISDLFRKPLLDMGNILYQTIDYDWAFDFFNNTPCADEEKESNMRQSLNPDKLEVASRTMDNDPTEVMVKEKSLFCHKCGAKLLSDSLYCSYCGTKVV